MVNILTALSLISSILIFYVLIILLNRKKISIKKRLNYINETYSNKIELDDRKTVPLKKRLLVPIKASFTKFIKKLTPNGIREQTERKLKSANYPYGLDVTGWFTFKIFFSVIIPLLFLIVLRFNTMELVYKVLLFLVVFIICLLFPNLVLTGRTKTKSNKIQKELPDTLDLLTISVEAGLSFEGALEKIVDKKNGELSREFGRALQEMQLGKTRREALSNITERCDVADLKVFISTILQAEKLGTSIGKVLRIQADQIRVKRKQRAQEQALKAPVKIIIPLVLFILPSIFIVILGPAIIQIKETFLK